jgi:Arc/MetJ-type ribon-helix-helix transcriptional regulator
MTTQIAVRLPDEIVAFLDAQVASGAAKSRADFIWHAIKREQRRVAAARDAATYSREGEDPGLETFAKHVAHLPNPELD